MDPCGTHHALFYPIFKLSDDESLCFFISTLTYLSIRYDLIKLLPLPVIPDQFNLSSKVSCLMQSNALSRSQNIQRIINFLSRTPMILLLS
jgi:hypothetical protein